MRPPRFTIIGLMVAVILAAILLAVFRAGSFLGLAALIPIGGTSMISRSGSTPLSRRWSLLFATVGTLAIPFIAAIWINHEMWGYYVNRPAVDRRLIDSRQIESVTRLEPASDSRGRRTFSGSPIADVSYFIQESQLEGDYYVLEGRGLRELMGRHALPEAGRTIPDSRLQTLYNVLDKTGHLEEGEPGYPNAKELGGIAIQGTGHDGQRILFVAVRGREVSNDHYPFYEFLFEEISADGPLKLLSFQRFYYDVAGVEGMEWPAFFMTFAFLGLSPTILVQGVFFWRVQRSRRSQPSDAISGNRPADNL